MMRRFLLIALLSAPLLVTLGGCTYYQVAPGTYASTVPSKFDRAWSAAVGAFDDQGVPVAREDRGTGVVQGTRDGITITANVRTQADGSVRVEFNSNGAISRDPDLINRVSRAYDRRMGR
ncbi:MAG: hypothetical protein R3E46_00730 [Sedimenticolaceae bacterium]